MELKLSKHILADHAIGKIKYHKKELEESPQIIKTRSQDFINSDNLMHEIKRNEKLAQIFKLLDPDKIVINRILNKISPTKIVQTKNSTASINDSYDKNPS